MLLYLKYIYDDLIIWRKKKLHYLQNTTQNDLLT